MAIIGIILSIFVFFLVGGFVGQEVLHNGQGGIWPALFAAVWTAWPFFHKHGIERYNLMHPPTKQYQVNLLQAFTRIRDILRETSYNYGDRWHVLTADVATNRIVAELRYIDEETRIDFDVRGHARTRTERLQRHIRLEAQLAPGSTSSSTTVQLDFMPKVEGVSYAACDHIINGVLYAVEIALGPGANIEHPASSKLPAPPWWLLAFSGLALFCFSLDVIKAVFQ